MAENTNNPQPTKGSGDEAEQTRDDALKVSLPLRTPLPPPPDFPTTRPHLGGTAPSTRRPAGTSSQTGHRPSQETSTEGNAATKLGAGLAASTAFAANIIAGLIIGQWIDHRWNHSGGTPWGTLIFTLLGVTSGFITLFKVISATDRSRPKK